MLILEALILKYPDLIKHDAETAINHKNKQTNKKPKLPLPQL